MCVGFSLRLNNDSSIVTWAIGNELNAPWNSWVGDSCSATCLYGDDVPYFFGLIDELCSVVKLEFGLLCTTVLADTPVPSK